MSAWRGWVEHPIADRDRQRAFRAAAVVLLLAAAVLTLLADVPHRSPAASNEPRPRAEHDHRAPSQAGVPPRALRVARRFVGGYLAYLHGERSVRDIPAATIGLRRQLAARPIRVSPSMRRQRLRIGRLDGHRLGGRWRVAAEITTTADVRFSIAVMVADRAGAPVVTGLVED